MNSYLCFILFLLGLIMIIKGSDWFIDAIIWVARVCRIPYIIIGATVVSICTTLPETFVYVAAALKGQTDYALGNAIGSTVVNTGLILAILLIFTAPVIENKKDFAKNGFILIGLVSFVLIIGLTLGEINRWISLFMFAVMVAYLLNNAMSAKKYVKQRPKAQVKGTGGGDLSTGGILPEEENGTDLSRKSIIRNVFFFLIGIVLVLVGANLLVDNGITIAQILGVPSIVVGITITAFGTSLPELVTTITSIRKKATNLGVGNIIGASILNIIQVISISAIIRPFSLTTEPSIVSMKLPLTLAIVTIAVLFGVCSRGNLKRWQGFVLLAGYVVFVVLNVV